MASISNIISKDITTIASLTPTVKKYEFINFLKLIIRFKYIIFSYLYCSWTIKAKVCNKSSIKEYKNQNGEGKLFTVDLQDFTYSIRATVFNENCDKFYDILQKNKTYFISKAMIKTANNQYSKSEYELNFGKYTIIHECIDESLPKIMIKLSQIKEIIEMNVNNIVGMYFFILFLFYFIIMIIYLFIFLYRFYWHNRIFK